MSEKALVPAPFRSQTYTIEEIDGHLIFIADAIRFLDELAKVEYLHRADQWLDKRNELNNV